MQGQKDPLDDASQSVYFDNRAIHKALKEAGGNISQAHRLLTKAGLAKSMDWLRTRIHTDRALKAVWVDCQDGYSENAAPDDLGKLGTDIQESSALLSQNQLIEKEAKFNETATVADVFGNDADKVLGFAKFASNAFTATINIVHGLSIKSAVDLQRQAEWIVSNVLECDDTVNKKVVAENGKVVELKDVPKYSEEDKLEWLKVYNDIMDKLRRFNDSANSAALARIKAQELWDKKNKAPNSGRGRRQFK